MGGTAFKKAGNRQSSAPASSTPSLKTADALLREYHQAGDIKFHDPEIEESFWRHTKIKNFADVYPKGERLKRLLATPVLSISRSMIDMVDASGFE